MEAKKIYLLIMSSNDDDYGGQMEIWAYETKEDALEEWKSRVHTELHERETSWVAEVFNEGEYDQERYEITYNPEGYFLFGETGWNKYVSWYVEEKELRNRSNK